MAAIMKNRYDVITPPADGPIPTRFGRSIQHDKPMTINGSLITIEPEVEFQYGGRLLSETVNN